jgi:hypothetical protein
MSVEYFERRLKLADERKPYKLSPVAFEASQYCTLEFATWWSLHYEKHAKNSDEVLLQAIEAGFDALQQKTPKGKGNLESFNYLIFIVLVVFNPLLMCVPFMFRH